MNNRASSHSLDSRKPLEHTENALPQTGLHHEGQDSPRSAQHEVDSRTRRTCESSRDVRIIIADDHPIVSLALSGSFGAISGFEVVATAKSGHELISALQSHPCDLVVTDFSMQPEAVDLDGFRLIERLQRMFPQIPIVVFTMLTNSGILSQLRRAGVAGIVSKEDSGDALISICIRALTEQGPILSDSINKRLSWHDGPVGSKKANGLSPRELEVVRMFGQGLSLTEIARRLDRSVGTIGTQKQSAMRKLQIDSNAKLLRYAEEQGFCSGARQP